MLKRKFDKHMTFVFTGIMLLMLVFTSCRNEPEVIDISNRDSAQRSEKDLKKERMLTINREIVRIEEQFIENYVRRHGLQVEKLESGIRYDIYKENPGGYKIREGDHVRISYSSKLLTGSKVETWDSLKTKNIVVSESEDVQGLHYALLEMREQEKGIFILPSNLAYGITGKRGTVPHSAALVYDISVKDVIRKK
ncbi:MAG: FKBP-type peptidyl-prolyl cis-trans isomerase [Bacteroidota bacterium]